MWVYQCVWFGESESEVRFILLPLPLWLQLMDCPLFFIVSSHFSLVKFSTLILVLPSHSGVMTKVSLLHSRPYHTCRSRGTSLVFFRGWSLSYRMRVTLRPELISWQCPLMSRCLVECPTDIFFRSPNE